jgi:hypothetical protein
MIEDCLFEYLQIGIMEYLKKTKNNNEQIQQALDSLGFRVGYSLIEKMAPDTSRFTDDITIMKFLCKGIYKMKK